MDLLKSSELHSEKSRPEGQAQRGKNTAEPA